MQNARNRFFYYENNKEKKTLHDFYVFALIRFNFLQPQYNESVIRVNFLLLGCKISEICVIFLRDFLFVESVSKFCFLENYYHKHVVSPKKCLIL